MRNNCVLTAGVMVIVAGLLFVPSPNQAVAEFKQLALAVFNYHDYNRETDPEFTVPLMPQSRDESLGLLIVERDLVVEAVVAPDRDSDFVNIRLSSGETVPAYVVSRDDGDLLLMDADGELALFLRF